MCKLTLEKFEEASEIVRQVTLETKLVYSEFFTQQTGAIYGVENLEMVRVMGHQYEVVMTVTKILAVVWGIFVGWLIQHTQSRQGRFRPWHLIFGFITIAIGCLIFLFPGNDLGGSYWYYFFFLIVC